MRVSGVEDLESMFAEVAMKNYTQVYVKNSFEAAETYCKAFGAEITREFKTKITSLMSTVSCLYTGKVFGVGRSEKSL
jgi:hypothetical protein